MFNSLGRLTENDLQGIILSISDVNDPGDRTTLISHHFLGIPYQESTLIGDESAKEELVINLGGVDCFTLLDYVEATRLSRSAADFQENLKKIRYKDGIISFQNRNHFFTDWSEYNQAYVRDVTEEIAGHRAKYRITMLNLRKDGTLFLKAIAPRSRKISYIPSALLDETVFVRLKTGDYAGIYSKQEGLDVSHVGIIIRDKDSLLLRHASSDKDTRKVIDQDLRQYMSDGKPGLIVLRPVTPA